MPTCVRNTHRYSYARGESSISAACFGGCHNLDIILPERIKCSTIPTLTHPHDGRALIYSTFPSWAAMTAMTVHILFSASEKTSD
mmetsp:Transcript_6565/g.17845  ORF Transcript_6565/g.17845 Transcript_6565/m.17845 type:complete len:85 (+) Transcript_6565:66-320(+)